VEFVRDNPGEPVPEETFTHSTLIMVIDHPNLLSPSTTNHGILCIQSTCSAVFFHNLSPLRTRIYCWNWTILLDSDKRNVLTAHFSNSRVNIIRLTAWNDFRPQLQHCRPARCWLLPHSMVCISVGHDREPCKNGWTDQFHCFCTAHSHDRHVYRQRHAKTFWTIACLYALGAGDAC